MTAGTRPPAASFTISGNWAHFRRIDTTTAKQTYRIIPRTTVMGLVGAILGYERDTYYETLGTEQCEIAISLETPITTMGIPQAELTTKGAYRSSHGGHDAEAAFLKVETTLEDRQRNFYEYLTNASYRIDVVHHDDDVRAALVETLSAGESVFTPTLGKSECLASIDWHGTDEPTGSDSSVSRSVVPLDIATPTGEHVATERSPRDMESDGRSRRTTDFAAYAYRKDGPEPIAVIEGSEVVDIHGRPVTFI